MPWTTIRISRGTLDRFNSLGKRGETSEVIMVRMIDTLGGSCGEQDPSRYGRLKEWIERIGKEYPGQKPIIRLFANKLEEVFK